VILPIRLRVPGFAAPIEGELEIPDGLLAPPRSEDELLTEAEAAAHLRMAPRTLKRHRLAGEIQATRSGRGWCYRRAWLDAFEAARTKAPVVMSIASRRR
jgi:hypothetical protein